MLILRPLAAQLSYLSINIFERRIHWATFTSDLERGPAFDLPKSSGVPRLQLPASRFQFLTSRLHYPDSKLYIQTQGSNSQDFPPHGWPETANRSIFGARGLRSKTSSMIFSQFSKSIFYEFVNAYFHLSEIQTREICVFTRVRNVFWNIVLFAFHQIFGCSNHGMLILRPAAAQLSYLLMTDPLLHSSPQRDTFGITLPKERPGTTRNGQGSTLRLPGPTGWSYRTASD